MRALVIIACASCSFTFLLLLSNGREVCGDDGCDRDDEHDYAGVGEHHSFLLRRLSIWPISSTVLLSAAQQREHHGKPVLMVVAWRPQTQLSFMLLSFL
jgi:hypothetical protein